MYRLRFLAFSLNLLKQMKYTEYSPGRLLLGNLPKGEDILASITTLCKAASVRTASFSVRGVVSSYTIGTYDPRQQVYVTSAESVPREIIFCSGNVYSRDGEVESSAHIVLADDRGALTGGRLFSETRIFSGEIRLQECIGPPPLRVYDDATGQMLWHFCRE
ncbi:hypothetical protein B2D07_04290 [Desulfococcus multivorans]|nr:hypothetical protein B2D07_04290 [Desulfococcus multivorans]